MNRRKKLPLIGILLLIGLMLSPLPVFAALLLSGEFPIASDTLQEVTPSVAFNSQRNQYLVVWSNDRPGNDDIRAQKVAADGSLIGGPFYISAGPGNDRWKPDVAYNSVQDQYLVVWEDYDNASMIPGKSIRARRVSGTGMVLDANDLIIREKNITFYTPVEPAVAYASVSDRYLVVWREVTHVGTPTHDIYSQVVTHQGNLSGSAQIITSSTKVHSAPDLAYNPGEDRYMVAWHEYNTTTPPYKYDVKGRQVAGNGTPWGAEATYGESGIAHQRPAVAVLTGADPNRIFGIAWIYDKSSWVGYGYVFTNKDGVKKQFNASYWYGSYIMNHIALSANPGSKTYLLACQFDQGAMDKNIYVAQTDSQFHFEEALTIPGPANDFPALAAGLSTDFLIAWQAQPLSITHSNIYGKIFKNQSFSYLPLIMR